MITPTSLLEPHLAAGLERRLSLPRGIDFSSNDYLGLTQNPWLREQVLKSIESVPLGSGGSRLLRGHSKIFEDAEFELARIFSSEAALFLNSGYMANLAVMTVLGGEGSEIFSDELNHASIIDGCRLSKAKINIFKHRDLNHLEELLRRSSAVQKIIVCESLFSMDGDFSPVDELLSLATATGSYLVVDEAHATGVWGPRGFGLTSDHHHKNPYLISLHTCGKALGSYGAFVTCSDEMKKLLVNKARPFIFSTALPPILVKMNLLAVQFVKAHPELRAQLHANLDWLKENWNSKIQSQIIPVVLGTNQRALAAAEKLSALNLDVRAIRYPTVPDGTARLRISVNALHRESDLRLLVQALKECEC